MEKHIFNNEITSRDYIRALFRQKPVIFIIIFLSMFVVIVGLLLKTPVYEAEVKMLITGRKHSQAEYYTDIGIGGMRNYRISLTQSEIVTADPVLERAASVMGLDKKPLDYENRFASKLKRQIVKRQVKSKQKKLDKFSENQQKAYLFRLAIEELRDNTKVEPIGDTDLFLIKVKDYNPLAAAVTANIISRSYIIFDLEQQLAEMKLRYGEKNQAVIQLNEAIEKMSTGLNGKALPPIEAIGPASVKIIEQAKVPLEPHGMSRLMVIILAFLVVLPLSIMIAFCFEYLDQTFRNPDEVQSFLGLDYLGSLPKNPKVDDYHDLTEKLDFILDDKQVKTILFASALQQDCVTNVISNLGVYISENLGKKVLLIDANLRTPALHTNFKLPETWGFMNMLEGKVPFNKTFIKINNKLDIITSGSLSGPVPSTIKRFIDKLMRRSTSQASLRNRFTILESDNMKLFLESVKQIYDLVLIVSSPLQASKDAARISPFVDGVVIVINEHKTRRPVVKNALRPLHSRKASILGVILTNRRFLIPKIIYDRV